MPGVEFSYDMDPSEVADRTYRVTAPLSGFELDQSEALPDRVDLGNGAVLARLDEQESERLEAATSWDSMRWGDIGYRLELHGVRAAEAHRQWRLLIHQFLLVVREPLSIVGVVLDRHVGGVWRRGGYMNVAPSTRWSRPFPSDRLATLAALRTGLGTVSPTPVLRALEHYEHSIASLWMGDFDDALVLAALSFESLLGNGVRTEISYRLCLRAATLVGEDPVPVFTRLRKLYDLRSGVVHEGKRASLLDATHMQQALMRLIPSVAALTTEVGSYESALNALDSLALDRSVDLPDTIRRRGWWSYVPLAECFRAELPERETSWPDGRVSLFDY